MRVVSLTNHSAILISQLLLLWDEPSSVLSFQVSPLSTTSLSSCRRRCCDGSELCWHPHCQYNKPPSSSRPLRHECSLHLSSNEYNNNDDTDKVSIKKKRSKRRKISSSKSHTTNNAHETKRRTIIPTMSTALCIVPPDDAWDTIQRARHLARDTSFYKWPPAIRLFHPFAPKKEIPGLVGMLADWMDDQNYDNEMDVVDDICGDDQGDDTIVGRSELQDLIDKSTHKIMTTKQEKEDPTIQPSNNSNEILSTFEITLDSILILPHFEILDARISALDNSHTIPKQQHLKDSIEETEYQKRKAQGLALIEEEERKGLIRKKERERKKRLKMLKKKKKKNESEMILSDEDEEEDDDEESSSSDEAAATTTSNKESNSNSYNGPCVIYLSPNDESRIKLETLRERLRHDLFSNYDGFSPSSSVSPYPECLPRKVTVRNNNDEAAENSTAATNNTPSSQFRPLLPVARFSTVKDAIKIAKILQQTWDPLTFNVTDIQFVSREDDMDLLTSQSHAFSSSELTTSGIGFGSRKESEEDLDSSIPEVRHRKKHGTLSSSSTTDNAHKRMGLTTSGEVEDISKQGIYGCDAMVMLLGEEPEESLMDEEASLSMIMDDNNGDEDSDDDSNHEEGNDDNNNNNNDSGRINYNEIFATAEREYQRMQAHEELSTASYVGDVPIFDSSVTDIEAWLDGDDDEMEDEGATVVIGRAQFFMGAMREFIGSLCTYPSS